MSYITKPHAFQPKNTKQTFYWLKNKFPFERTSVCCLFALVFFPIFDLIWIHLLVWSINKNFYCANCFLEMYFVCNCVCKVYQFEMFDINMLIFICIYFFICIHKIKLNWDIFCGQLKWKDFPFFFESIDNKIDSLEIFFTRVVFDDDTNQAVSKY